MARFTSAGDLMRAFHQRREAVTRELTAAARELGPEVSGEAKRVMQDEIYSVPIPLKRSSDKKLSANAAVRTKTTKGKHGAWQRTGALKRGETWSIEGPVLVLRNNVAYSVPRNNLGTPSGRQIKTPGVRSVQWQTEAISRKRTRILEVRRRHVLRALSGGAV